MGISLLQVIQNNPVLLVDNNIAIHPSIISALPLDYIRIPSPSPSLSLITIGSDGLWDNLYEKAIVDIVNELLPVGPTTTTTNSFSFTSLPSAIICRLSNAIGTKAREMSLLREDYLSPFGMAGLAAGEIFREDKAALAGKPDDITVIVSVAVPLNRNKIHPHPQPQLPLLEQQQEEEVLCPLVEL